MEIILFGQLADIVGKTKLETEKFADTEGLKDSLVERFPGLREIKFMLAVNKQMVQNKTLLNGDETIALMPPFSGG